MTALLDVNVLIALAWPSHVHHRIAHRWFERQQSAGWATCPVTQSGFVRISSNPRVFPDAKSARTAHSLLTRIVTLPHHRFLVDDIDLTSSAHIDSTRWFGHRQVADAHLLAIAMRHQVTLATLDRSIGEVLPAHRRSKHVVLISDREQG